MVHRLRVDSPAPGHKECGEGGSCQGKVSQEGEAGKLAQLVPPWVHHCPPSRRAMGGERQGAHVLGPQHSPHSHASWGSHCGENTSSS